jgi:hypothetical protein
VAFAGAGGAVMATGGAGSGLAGGEFIDPFTISTSDWDGYASATYSIDDEEEQPARTGSSATAAIKPIRRVRSRRLLFAPRMLTDLGLVDPGYS